MDKEIELNQAISNKTIATVQQKLESLDSDHKT